MAVSLQYISTYSIVFMEYANCKLSTHLLLVYFLWRLTNSAMSLEEPRMGSIIHLLRGVIAEPHLSMTAYAPLTCPFR